MRLIVGGVLLAVGAGGATYNLTRERPSEVAILLREHGNTELPGSSNGGWSYTYAVANEAGVPSMASDGLLRWEEGCEHTGRVIVGEVLVNPGSSREDVSEYLNTAEVTLGVGRIAGNEREAEVQLPDGSISGGVPLLWFQPENGNVCAGLGDVFTNMSEMEVLDGTDVLGADLLAQDRDENVIRYVGKWRRTGGGVATRPELLINQTGFSVVVRKMVEGSQPIALARLDLQPEERGAEMRTGDSTAR
jgi:hypothetical protein